MAAQRPDPGRLSAVGYALLLCGLCALCAVRKVQDWDTFWHLRTAAEALRTHSSVPRDSFSFSVPGSPWPYKDLLAEIILYLGFERLGYAWFAVLRALAIAVYAAALWIAPPALRRSTTAWLLGLALALLAVSYRVADRPMLFSLALFPLFLALLERARRACAETDPRALWRGFAPLALVQAGWLQLHREAMIGLVVLVGLNLYLGGALLLRGILGERTPQLLPRPSRRAPLAALPTLLVPALLGLLNLCGLQFYRTAIAAFTTISWQEVYILEWRAMSPAELWALLPLATAVCAAGLLAILGRLALASRERGAETAAGADPGTDTAPSVDLWHLGCWLVFAYQTHRSVRWLSFLVAVSALALLLVAGEALQRLAARGVRLPRGRDALLGVAALCLLHLTHPQPLGLGEAPSRFPAQALAFAKRHGLHERVANAFPFGGYLLWHGWPRFKVLVDGRNDLLYPAAFMLSCNRGERDPATFARMRAADGADWVLAGNQPDSLSHKFLRRDPAWALVQYNDAAAVYVLRSAYPQLKDLELRYVARLLDGDTVAAVRAAALLEGPQAEARLAADLQRVIDETPGDLSGHVWLAQLYQEQGQRERRDQVLRHLMRERPELPSIEGN